MGANKKHVMLFMGKVDMGGIENLFLNIIPLLSDEYKFYIAYYVDGENELEDEFRVLGCEIDKIGPNRYTHPIKFINSIRRYIEEKQIDIVHCNVGYSTFYALIAARLEKVPVRIAHSHNSEFGSRANPANRVFEAICKLSCHEFATDRINVSPMAAGGLFLKSDDSLFVPNGVDLQRFEFSDEARRRVRTELNIAADAPVIVSVGRLEEVKNHKFALEVFKRFRKNHPDAHYIVVGSGSLEDELKTRAEREHLSDFVHFTGPVDNPQDYSSAADVLLMPSLYEGLGMALVEAQQNGLECFASTDVDTASKVSDHIHYLALAEGPEAWAAAMDTYWPKTRETLGDSALIQKFDMHNTAQAIREIYQER